MTKDEALKLALEALENHEGNYKLGNAGCDRQEAAITAIKEALAPTSTQCEEQPEQEPQVRTGDCLLVGVCASEGHKIQAQRPWVGLTDEEVKHEWEVWRASLPRYVGFAKGIETKLKEKNT